MPRYKCWSCRHEYGTENVEAVCVQCYVAMRQRVEAAERCIEAARKRLDVWTRETFIEVQDAVKDYDAQYARGK